jgi:hypothetical protein
MNVPHPNDKPLEEVVIGGEFFILSPKKGWLWSEKGKCPTAYSLKRDAEANAYSLKRDAEAKLQELAPRFHGKLELFERLFEPPSRKRPYYRIRALFTEADLHAFRGSFAGHKFGF